jgi:hypothetical protein
VYEDDDNASGQVHITCGMENCHITRCLDSRRTAEIRSLAQQQFEGSFLELLRLLTSPETAEAAFKQLEDLAGKVFKRPWNRCS